MARSGPLPVSVNEALLEASWALPACLSAATRAAAPQWSGCHRNHVVCTQNMFTLWPFVESPPALALEKAPGLSRTLAFLDNFCLCGEVTEKIMPLQSPSRKDPAR